MTERVDPLDAFEDDRPTLAECIEPYREYGDAELAVTLLAFQRRFQIGIPSINPTDAATFEVNAQPADAGAKFVCDTCDEAVRPVSIPTKGVYQCPLCQQTPSMLALGKGVQGDSDA